jgi:hypothetical protein
VEDPSDWWICGIYLSMKTSKDKQKFHFHVITMRSENPAPSLKSTEITLDQILRKTPNLVQMPPSIQTYKDDWLQKIQTTEEESRKRKNEKEAERRESKALHQSLASLKRPKNSHTPYRPSEEEPLLHRPLGFIEKELAETKAELAYYKGKYEELKNFFDILKPQFPLSHPSKDP